LLGTRAVFKATQGPGQGEELALEAAQTGAAIVVAAGGDGTVHEVANGILRAGRQEVALAVVPVGSANDYAYSLENPACWSEGTSTGPGSRAVDVGWVRCANGRERYFVNGLGLGFNGAVTQESRRIRWLRGVPLYSWALVRAAWRRFQAPCMTLTVDSQVRQEPTLALTVAIGRREGNFILAPEAKLDDGLFDYLQAGALSRWELVQYIPGMISGRLPKDDPAIWTGLCREVSLSSEASLVVHLDGELLCIPENDVRSLDVRILPRGLLVRTGNVEAWELA
jgi:diacylglycerol kinase family enzyme